MKATTLAATLPYLDRRREAGGIAIEVVISPGVSAAGRIVVHEGLIINEGEFGTRATALLATSFYFAFYAQSLLDAQCEPYDQPSHAAYLPLGYSSLKVVPIPGYGAMLMQCNPSSRVDDESLSADGIVSLVWTAKDENELRNVLGDVAALAGVPESASKSLATPENLLNPPGA